MFSRYSKVLSRDNNVFSRYNKVFSRNNKVLRRDIKVGLTKFKALMRKENNVDIRNAKYILRSIKNPGIAHGQ